MSTLKRPFATIKDAREAEAEGGRSFSQPN